MSFCCVVVVILFGPVPVKLDEKGANEEGNNAAVPTTCLVWSAPNVPIPQCVPNDANCAVAAAVAAVMASGGLSDVARDENDDDCVEEGKKDTIFCGVEGADVF